MSYSGNLITKVEYKTNTTVVDSVEYAYNVDDELTKVTDHSSEEVAYTYGTNVSATGSRYVASITDKTGTETDLTWSFVYADSTWQAYKIDQDRADGLRTTYDRSASTGVCSVTNVSGGTTLNKFVYTPVSGDPSRAQYLDYYHGDLTNYERWSYEYDGAVGDLTRAAGPGNVQLAAYTYTSTGREGWRGYLWQGRFSSFVMDEDCFLAAIR